MLCRTNTTEKKLMRYQSSVEYLAIIENSLSDACILYKYTARFLLISVDDRTLYF